jgi:hypothetical protein
LRVMMATKGVIPSDGREDDALVGAGMTDRTPKEFLSSTLTDFGHG